MTLLLLLALLMLITGCSSLQNESCPYLITEQYVSFDSGKENFNYAGAVFCVLNNSLKNIEKMTLCFSLFDGEENLIGFGNGIFKTTFDGEIEGGCKKEIIISLDDVLGNAADSECRLDFVYVSEIVYADGSVWQDYFGLYSL